MPNAIELLKKDHATVKELLAKLVETTSRAKKARAELLGHIERELQLHTMIEEEIFYPAFKKADGSEHQKMYFEAMEEHRAVEELLLPDLKKTDPGSEQFAGRAKVLKELIEHHLQEEEKEMFKKARKAFSSEQLTQLGKRMEERKLGAKAAA